MTNELPAASTTTWRIPRGAIPAALLTGFVLILATPAPTLTRPDGVKLAMTPEAWRIVAIMFLMAGLWISQVVPMAATSLLPLVLFPLFGIQSAKEVSRAFISDMQFLFIGGFIIALGLERWHVHRRIALHIVNRVGVRPRQLVLGMMIATAALSMWISNTATTLMMVPIALALLRTIDSTHSDLKSDRTTAMSPQLALPMLLGIAYAASLGGMTTIVGTPTNTVAVAIYQAQLPEAPELSVAQWMMAAIPVGVVYFGIVWLVLTWSLKRDRSSEAELGIELKRHLNALGPITAAEVRMLVVFAAVAVLWVLRQPLRFGNWTLVPGWSTLLDPWFQLLGHSNQLSGAVRAENFVSDSTVAIALAVLMFFIPSGIRDESGRRVPLMNWETAVKMPWEIILLFGGGLALASGFSDKVSGLASWLGQALQGPLQGQSTWLVIAVICLTMTFLTEVTSNVATISTVLPSLLIISEQLDIDSRLLLIPATLATSCAFMLPIATAPNAIVFGSGRITPGQMARYGVLLNLVGVPLLTAAACWYIGPLLGITERGL
ncbi:MAG: SLC13 family permease [Fuerstiella sp.]|nr:SLC13 family permease [Fuerstiella sp.]